MNKELLKGLSALSLARDSNISGAFLVAQLEKNLPVIQEAWVQSLDWEDHLENEKPTPVFSPEESHEQRSLAG